MFSKRIKRIILIAVLLLVPVTTAGCGNLIDEIVSNRGTCPGADWGMKCNN